MKILTVCGMGSGSSLILKINVDAILKELNLKAQVDAIDVGSYKSAEADIIFSTKDLARQLKDASVPVVLLQTVLDKKTIKEELIKFKEEHGWK